MTAKAEASMRDFLVRLSNALRMVANDWPGTNLDVATTIAFAGFVWPTNEARRVLEEATERLHREIERLRQ